MKKTLKLHDITYEINFNDEWTNKQGNTYRYISIKKIRDFKGGKKYQNLTINHSDWEEFRKWLLEIAEFQYEEGEEEDEGIF